MKTLNSNYSLILKLFLFIYIFSLIFHNFIIYDLTLGINPKISELVFIPFILILIFFSYKSKFQIIFTKNDYLIILFCSISIFHIFWINTYKSYLFDILINIYFLFIFFSFKILIKNKFKSQIINYIKFSSLVAASIAIIGWIIYQLNITNFFVIEYQYPFKILKSARAISLFEHPNAMFNFLVFSFLIYFIEVIKNRKKNNFIFLIIISLALLLSFSKSIFILIGLIFYIFFLNNYKFKKIFLFLSILFLLTYVIFSHLIIVNKDSQNYKYYTSSKFVSPKKDKKIEFLDYDIYLNNYFEMKLQSLSYWKENIIFGNNSLEFSKFKKKIIPHEDWLVKSNNNHSTYFGILANKGVLGLILYSIILYNLFKSYNNQSNLNRSSLLFLIYIIIEGLNTDLLSLKLTWILFALIESSKKNKI